jgi:hypothetical protein
MAQSGASLGGTIVDPSDRPVFAAQVDLTDSEGKRVFHGTTDLSGAFLVPSLPAGKYRLHVHSPNFEDRSIPILMKGREKQIRIALALTQQQYAITVSAQGATPDMASSANQNAVILGSQQIEQLPVKDGDVLSALTIFTNPAGGVGPTIVVDGMERTDSVTLTPSMVQEVRIDSDEYSAEFPKPGKNRIEVTTKSGGDAIHGEFAVRARDSVFDARNPFAAGKPAFARYGEEASLSGPVVPKQLFFFLAVDREKQEQAAPVRAILPMGLFTENVLAPLNQYLITGRLDFAATSTNTLSARYELHEDQAAALGVGGLTLPNAGVDHFHHDDRWEISDQETFSPNLLNNFRLALGANYEQFTSETSAPSIAVSGAFQSGGAQRDDWRREPRAEFLDSLIATRGSVTIKAGAEARFHPFRDYNADDYGGTYVFPSLEAYAVHQPSLYTVNAGNPLLSAEQDEYDWYLQAEKQYRRFSVSAGLRDEFQSHLAHYANLAPRLALAWALDRRRKTILRAGAGVFYDRRPPVILEQALLVNGLNTMSYLVPDPSFPILQPLPESSRQTSVYEIDRGMVLPRLYQGSAAIEEELPGRFVVSAEYTYQRGTHLFRTRNINAPLPVSGLLPFPNDGNIYQIESSASSRADMLNFTLKSPPNRRFLFLAQYTLSYLWNDTYSAFGPPPPGGMGPAPGAGLNNLFVVPPDPYDLRPEWGPAGNDIRDRFGFSGSVFLPWRLTLGTLTSIHTGLPYDITTGTVTPYDPYPNARPPGVTRNTGRGAGFFAVDIHLARDFPFRVERKQTVLQLAVDSFNVTNHRNPSAYVGVVTSPLFGQPDAGYNGREMQFSAHLRF